MKHTPAPITPADVKSIGIERLCQWAFGTEKVQLDPVAASGAVDLPRYLGYGSIWGSLMEIAALGRRVDTSPAGATFVARETVRAADDAEAVAAVLAGMIATGDIDRRAALTVVHHATIGTRPHWYEDATPRVEPRRWKCAGESETEKAGTIRYHDRGRWRTHESRYCPITYAPTVQQINTTREAYLGWWQALRQLREALIGGGVLKRHRLTGAMPAAMPWIEAGMPDHSAVAADRRPPTADISSAIKSGRS